jgi:hypothetical protein
MCDLMAPPRRLGRAKGDSGFAIFGRFGDDLAGEIGELGLEF